MKPLLVFFFLFSVSGLMAQEGPKKQVEPDFNQILSNPHVSIRLCGDLNYTRVRRDCSTQLGMDFRNCLKMEQNDPVLVEQDATQYVCVNSETSQGVAILNKFFKHRAGSCLKRKVENLSQGILEDKKLMSLFERFKSTFGQNLKINYGVDTTNHVAILQVDFNELNIKGIDQKSIQLNMSLHQENGPCPMWDRTSIYNQLNGEFIKISKAHARENSGKPARLPASTVSTGLR